VGLLAKDVSAGRGRLVHRRKTKEAGNSAKQKLILADSQLECQRPCSGRPNGKPIRLPESEMKKDRGLVVLVGVVRCRHYLPKTLSSLRIRLLSLKPS
jgi:hypothetical protein